MPRSWRGLAALARIARVAVCADDAAQVAAIEAAAADAGVRLPVLVEIDVGAGRCGVAPGPDAVELAKRIAASKHLIFGGLQAYHGSAQHRRTVAERRTLIGNAVDASRRTVEQLRQQGLDCPIVGGAGTGTFQIESASGVYNEIQAGSYVFMDADYARNLDEAGAPIGTFRHSLFVLATVMSVPNKSIAVVDAGHKAVAVDSGMPTIWQRPDIRYVGASDEHGKMEVGIGDGGAEAWARSCGWCRGTAIRQWTATTGMSACGTDGWSACGRSRRGAGCTEPLLCSADACDEPARVIGKPGRTLRQRRCRAQHMVGSGARIRCRSADAGDTGTHLPRGRGRALDAASDLVCRGTLLLHGRGNRRGDLPSASVIVETMPCDRGDRILVAAWICADLRIDLLGRLRRSGWQAFLTSEATTAKPLPASPARAASIVAFSASRLVWLVHFAASDRAIPICLTMSPSD